MNTGNPMTQQPPDGPLVTPAELAVRTIGACRFDSPILDVIDSCGGAQRRLSPEVDKLLFYDTPRGRTLFSAT